MGFVQERHGNRSAGPSPGEADCRKHRRVRSIRSPTGDAHFQQTSCQTSSPLFAHFQPTSRQTSSPVFAEHRALKERLWGAFRPPAPYASSRGAGYEIDSCFTPAKNYTVVVPGTGHPQVTDGDLGVVFPLSTDARHLYHAVELLVPLFGWLNEFFPGRKVDIVVVPADMYNERILGSLLRAVFPEASIVLHGEVHLRDALVADPTKRPHRDWTPVEVNMGNASFLIRSVHVSSEWFPLFQGRVLSAFGVTHKARPRSAQEVQALYIYREQSVRELAWEIIEEMKALFLSAHGVHLQTVVLDSLSLGEQVELFAHTDLVIGVHGNGLTNLIWMPDHGGVFELFPADFHFYFFQMLAEASGHHFCGIQEGNPHPYKRWSRRDDAYGCTRGPPKAIDWELFMAEVDYALKRILTHQGA